MRKIITLLIASIVVLTIIILLFLQKNRLAEKKKFATLQQSNTPMKIVSPLFMDGDNIPARFTCQGENVNPPLQFIEVPHEAESLVLIMDDPDAPMGTWVHWTIYEMERTETFIDVNSKPKTGIEGMTSFGKPGYGGPCPPSGTHRYFFKLYALNSKLHLPDNADKKQIEAAMEGHVLQQAELMGKFSKG